MEGNSNPFEHIERICNCIWVLVLRCPVIPSSAHSSPTQTPFPTHNKHCIKYSQPIINTNNHDARLPSNQPILRLLHIMAPHDPPAPVTDIEHPSSLGSSSSLVNPNLDIAAIGDRHTLMGYVEICGDIVGQGGWGFFEA
jgi:hypothetical protein